MKNEDIPPMHTRRRRLQQPPLARLLQSGLIIILMLIGMQLHSFAVCENCWNREYWTQQAGSASAAKDVMETSLEAAQDALNLQLYFEDPDYDEIANLNTQISELTASIAQADSIIATAAQMLQSIPQCTMNPPCGQGVPQDPAYEDPPPAEDPPQDPPQDPPPYNGDPIPVYDPPPPPDDDPTDPPGDPDPIPV
ncbi:hypothetical protein [Prosthecobacter sp.]|uniref:hypothetical protein n=1 Tax=Prosthecobacter sp. TaxID=1965333 RepID=UPI0037839052